MVTPEEIELINRVMLPPRPFLYDESVLGQFRRSMILQMQREFAIAVAGRFFDISPIRRPADRAAYVQVPEQR